jgi:hypothetical protein
MIMFHSVSPHGLGLKSRLLGVIGVRSDRRSRSPSGDMSYGICAVSYIVRSMSYSGVHFYAQLSLSSQSIASCFSCLMEVRLVLLQLFLSLWSPDIYL